MGKSEDEEVEEVGEVVDLVLDIRIRKRRI